MSDLTLPEVRRCLQRIVVAAMEGKDEVVAAEARLALHLLSEWTDADLEAVANRWLYCSRHQKGASTPHALLDALDPPRASRRT